ncbi:MAG: hypothetical protein IJH12_04320 [Clostridia bacterium]|nr:hypothetical protein [Clostridia bacterium]
MAKQKSGKVAKLSVTEKKGVPPVRIRTTEIEAAEVLARALKRGAVRVGTRTVSPNQVEAFAEFAKKALADEFKTWIQKKHSNWLVADIEGES